MKYLLLIVFVLFPISCTTSSLEMKECSRMCGLRGVKEYTGKGNSEIMEKTTCECADTEQE